MKVGRKSLLFGVHNIIWHPITVYVAWVKLYKEYPTWREAFCILIHDWGYWKCNDMDGKDGQEHPYAAACILRRLGWEDKYIKLCMFHSRTFANNHMAKPSKLCWADKLSMCYDPVGFYLFRARLSGELKEYRSMSAASGLCSIQQSDKEWFRCIRDFLSEQGIQGVG